MLQDEIETKITMILGITRSKSFLVWSIILTDNEIPMSRGAGEHYHVFYIYYLLKNVLNRQISSCRYFYIYFLSNST